MCTAAGPAQVDWINPDLINAVFVLAIVNVFPRTCTTRSCRFRDVQSAVTSMQIRRDDVKTIGWNGSSDLYISTNLPSTTDVLHPLKLEENPEFATNLWWRSCAFS